MVTVTYNGRAHLEECLGSLLAQSRPADEILVVDNASSDGSLELIRERFPGVRLLVQPRNLGFAPACNLAAQAATSEVVAFVNNDARFDRQWLQNLVAPLEADSALSAVQSLILLYAEPELINTSATALNFLGVGWCNDYRRPRAEARSGEIPVLSGAAFAIRRQLYLDAGGFDDDYFMYHEDVDLSWRLRLMGGSLQLAASSLVFHKYQFGRAGQKNYLLERNRLLTLLKNYRLPTLVLVAPALLAMEIGVCLLALRQGWLGGKLRGYGDVVSSLPAIHRKRRAVRGLRRLSDRALTRWWVGSIDFEEIKSPLVSFGSLILRAYWAVARVLIRW
ncbi:MAG TPA: glycosyltransferase family 2 protein [Candidatus Eisenbacteria bacterium]|nr:glycosyltransferase family 2 protein [Candidatus Eisenbacteria bacterium]